MNIAETKKQITDGKFDESFKLLYGEVKDSARRYLGALDEFKKLYGDCDNIRLFSAPGRTEVGGNHTDHQHGRVLAGSVNLDVIAIVGATGNNTVKIKSAGYPMDELDICDLDKKEEETGKACSLIRGVCAAFKNGGFTLGGFNAYTTSNVLKGSGLSSSAAFEVLVSNIINGLFCDNKVDAVTIAKYSQFAEREHFGKPCGLLDQMASSVGGFTFADFNDPKEPIVEKIDVDLSKSGYTLCVVDTGGNHADLTNDYADITVECKKVSNALGVEFLRDADADKFYSKIADLRESCGDRAVLRAFHFFNENERVLAQKAALESENFEEFFSLVNDSGNSSFDYLQNLYPVSNPQEQGLSLAIAFAKQYLQGCGACRVHGGGFAGTIQCYVPNEKLSGFKKLMESVFGAGACVPLKIRPVGGYELI